MHLCRGRLLLLARVLQRNRTSGQDREIQKEVYYKGLVRAIMEAEESHDLPSAGWTVQVRRLYSQGSRWWKSPSAGRRPCSSPAERVCSLSRPVILFRLSGLGGANPPWGGMACFPQSPGNTLTDTPTDNVTKYLGPLVVRSRGHLQSTFTVTEVAGVGLGALWENSTAVGLPSLASLICEMGWWHLPHGVVG